MNFVLKITLLVGTVIVASAELSFPSSDYYGSHEVAVRNVDPSKITLPPELEQLMNKKRSPAKDIYAGIYMPLPDASENEIPTIQMELLSALFYVPVPVAADGFRLFLIDTRGIGGFKRHIYSDTDYHIYVKV